MKDCYVYCFGNNSIGVRLKSDGFASGPLEIVDSQFYVTSEHSNVTQVFLDVNASQMRRLLCQGNTFNGNEQTNITAVYIICRTDCSGSGMWRFIANNFHNVKYGIRTDPDMVAYTYDIRVGPNNSFDYYWTTAESGSTQIYFDSHVLASYVIGNYFEGRVGAGSIAIDDDGKPDNIYEVNTVKDNTFRKFDYTIQPNYRTIIENNRGYNPVGLIANPVSSTYIVDSGTGSIAKVTFHCTGAGQSILTIRSLDLFTSQGWQIPAISADGRVVQIGYWEPLKLQH